MKIMLITHAVMVLKGCAPIVLYEALELYCTTFCFTFWLFCNMKFDVILFRQI